MFQNIKKLDFRFSVWYFPGIIILGFVYFFVLTVLGILNIFNNDSLVYWGNIILFYGIYTSFIIGYLWYLGLAIINIFNKSRLVQSGLAIFTSGLFLAIFVIPSIFRLNVTPEDWFVFWFLIFPIYPIYHAIEAYKYSKKVS